MNQFTDEVYENMDDISKLIEPFESSVNNELAKFPDEIELSHLDILYIIDSDYSWREAAYSSIDSILKLKSKQLSLHILNKALDNGSFVKKAFILEAELDEGSTGIIFNYTDKKIQGGKIFLRKKIVGLEDQDIENNMSMEISTMSYAFHDRTTSHKKRLNEVAELFGAKEACKARKWNDKVRLLISHYQDMLKNKQIPIKDVDLFARFINWNKLYIDKGSLPAMANMARLKIMFRSGLPIYSMKEEDV